MDIDPVRFEVCRTIRVDLSQEAPDIDKRKPVAAAIAAFEFVRRCGPREGTYIVDNLDTPNRSYVFSGADIIDGHIFQGQPRLNSPWYQLERPGKPNRFAVTWKYTYHIFEENRLVQDDQLAYRAAKRAYELFTGQDHTNLGDPLAHWFVVEPIGTQELERWLVNIREEKNNHQVWDSDRQDWRYADE